MCARQPVDWDNRLYLCASERELLMCAYSQLTCCCCYRLAGLSSFFNDEGRCPRKIYAASCIDRCLLASHKPASLCTLLVRLDVVSILLRTQRWLSVLLLLLPSSAGSMLKRRLASKLDLDQVLLDGKAFGVIVVFESSE